MEVDGYALLLPRASWRDALSPAATLHEAARRGDVARLAHLVEVEGADAEARDEWDATPLYYASLCGHVPCLTYLLERGVCADEDSFDGDRVHYAALNDGIRRALRSFAAANRQR